MVSRGRAIRGWQLAAREREREMQRAIRSGLLLTRFPIVLGVLYVCSGGPMGSLPSQLVGAPGGMSNLGFAPQQQSGQGQALSLQQHQQQQQQQQQLAAAASLHQARLSQQQQQQQQQGAQSGQPNFQSVSQNQQRLGVGNAPQGLPAGMRQPVGSVGPFNPQRLQQPSTVPSANPFGSSLSHPSAGQLSAGNANPLLNLQQANNLQQQEILHLMKQQQQQQQQMQQQQQQGPYGHMQSLQGGGGGSQSSLPSSLSHLQDPHNSQNSQQQQSSAAPFDLSDFPALGGMSDKQGMGGAGGQGGVNASMAAMSLGHSSQQQQQQQHANNNDSSFVIQDQDFPALGGGGGGGGGGGNSRRNAPAPSPSSAAASAASLMQQQQQQQQSSVANSGAPPTAAALLQQRAVGGNAGAIGQTTPATGNSAGAPGVSMQQTGGAMPLSGAPPRAALPRPAKAQTCERYGLTGLLSVIRMTDQDLNTLALGTDLTTLGLNLNSSEVLYATFAAPCLDVPTRSEPDFVLPFCYYMQPPALKTSHLAKFTLETLFYIFYNMPKDTLQVYAAKELYKREWRYHKELKLWFSRAAANTPGVGGDPKKDGSNAAGGGVTKDASGKDLGSSLSGGGGKPLLDSSSSGAAPADSNTYLYFDINTWERRIFRETHILQPSKFMTEEDTNVLGLPVPRHAPMNNMTGQEQQQQMGAQQQQQQQQQQQHAPYGMDGNAQS